jgi:excisionase family DNA binding protein
VTLTDAPDVLTVGEAAVVARVGRNAMYAAVKRGDVYGATIGRSIRIPKQALMAWLLGPLSTENGFEAIIPGAVHLESSISALPRTG